VSEPTTKSGRWLIDHQGLVNISKPADRSMRGDEIDLRQSVATIEAEARALLLDELEAAVRGMLRTDVDDVSVLALIQQHREAIR
jgi:hypothetical protein